MSTRSLVFLIVLGLVLAAGCATLPPRPVTLQVRIEPDTIYPGDVVTARVEAPEGTRDAKGRLELPGSPVIPLRTRDNGKTWSFVTQIPIDAVWQPGRYKVVVTAQGPDGVRLIGEAWITAP